MAQRGFNGCFDQAIKALRYLSDNVRPNGGQQHYNAAHLLQIADEIEHTLKEPKEAPYASFVETLLGVLRSLGWSVAVHNDYRINGEMMTFWLFTHADGRYAKGEAKTDTARWRIWRAVNGAVADAFKAHPDYLAPGQERAARESIVKRIMGEIIALELRRETAEGLSGKTSGQNNGSVRGVVNLGQVRAGRRLPICDERNGGHVSARTCR